MTVAAESSPTPRQAAAEPAAYQPGVCNIGPEEIARRRRAGHIGAVITVIALVALVALHAPPLVRLVLAIPAAGAASGYLQAWLRFCAGFGAKGVFNFGQLGQVSPVADDGERALDRVRATQIGLASLLIGVAVGTVAALLPV